MKIAICGSLNHYEEMRAARSRLEELGHEVYFPHTAEKILKGETNLDEVDKHKKNYSKDVREHKHELMTKHRDKIRNSDAILVVNFEKNGIRNYIGGNTFLEMGFALAYDKKIYLLNPVPEIAHKDEITGMLPIVLDGKLEDIA